MSNGKSIVNRSNYFFCNHLGSESHISFHDVPSTYYSSFRIKKYIDKEFNGWVNQFKSADFISDSMKEKYQNNITGEVNYGMKRILKSLTLTKKIVDAKTVSLAFVGSVRFKKELVDLADSFYKLNTKIHIHLFSNIY